MDPTTIAKIASMRLPEEEQRLADALILVHGPSTGAQNWAEEAAMLVSSIVQREVQKALEELHVELGTAVLRRSSTP